MDEQSTIGLDYYQILGLNRHSSMDEIKKSYRKLAVSFHPDKFTDEKKKQLAQAQLRYINIAYNILSDEQTKKIYDKFGEEGIQVYMDLKHEKENIEYSEFLKELKRARFYKNVAFIDDKVSYHTSLFMFMDMGSFDQWNILTYLNSIHSLQLLKFPIDEKQEIVAKSHLFASYEASKYSSLSLSYQRLVSHLTVFKLILEGKWNVISLYAKIVQTLNDDTTMTLKYGIFGEKEPSLKIERIIDDNSSAKLSFSLGDKLLLKPGYNRTGTKSAINVSAESDTESATIHLNTKYQLKKNTFIGGNLKFLLGRSKPLKNYSLRQIFRNFGIDFNGYIEKHFSRTTSLSVACSYSFNRVQITLSLSRLNHYLSIPIVISDTLSLRNILFSIVAPTIFNFLYDFSYRKFKQVNEANDTETASIKDQKLRAKNFNEVMAEEIKKKQEEERRKQGLVILKAYYGNLPEHSDIKLNDNIIDVTLPLQYLVKNSTLILDEGLKSNLNGFYDPCPNLKKALDITYTLNNEIHKVRINDNEKLQIP